MCRKCIFRDGIACVNVKHPGLLPTGHQKCMSVFCKCKCFLCFLSVILGDLQGWILSVVIQWAREECWLVTSVGTGPWHPYRYLGGSQEWGINTAKGRMGEQGLEHWLLLAMGRLFRCFHFSEALPSCCISGFLGRGEAQAESNVQGGACVFLRAIAPV